LAGGSFTAVERDDDPAAQAAARQLSVREKAFADGDNKAGLLASGSLYWPHLPAVGSWLLKLATA
jgi:hypothetical protein